MPDNLVIPPVCDVDFYSESTIADTVNAYHKMLALGPVVWLQKNQLTAICSHAAVTAALRNFKHFSSARGVSIDADTNKMIVGSSLNSDPPQHNITRGITFKPLSTKALEDVKQRISEEANFIVEKVVSQSEFDAAKELAPHLPLTVVRDLVGLGDHGKKHMLDWGAATFELMGNPGGRRASAIEKLKEMRTFLEDAETVHGLSENGWARRAIARGLEQGMEPAQAAELMRDYIAPSLDTTISSITYAIYLFAKNPEQWTKLRNDRSLVNNAVEEIVRLNTPIRAFSRYVTKDIELAGHPLEKDSRVLVVFGAANRDPERFEKPDIFDISRKLTGHVGFGHGVHACLGMHLARLEISSLLQVLAEKVKQFEIIGPIHTGLNSSIHALASVPVRIHQ